MKFSYNSDLDFFDRVKLVADEICKEYPLIGVNEAALAAAHSVAVDDRVTNDEKFNRYYYIMKAIGRHHDEFPHVFNDAYKLYEEGLGEEKYIQTMEQLIDYAIGYREDFPLIVEG